jgi:ABC-type nitrate/sulfonate/bicarbonate transport system substrate-binding protein
MNMAKTNTLRLGLDWHPTPLHAGLFAAKNSQAYSLEIISPEADGYYPSPLDKLKCGVLDLAIVSPEAIYQNPDIVAVAAMQQPGASMFLVHETSNHVNSINYGHYGIPYEKQLINALWSNQQWEAAINFHEETPQLSLWSAFTQYKIDMLWVFKYWELALWQQSAHHHKTTQLELSDLGIPYPYTPVLATRRVLLQHSKTRLIAQLLHEAARHYQHICANTAEAQTLLLQQVSHPALMDRDFVRSSFEMAAQFFLDADGQWGNMQQSVWDEYAQWLLGNNIITKQTLMQCQPLFVDLSSQE